MKSPGRYKEPHPHSLKGRTVTSDPQEAVEPFRLSAPTNLAELTLFAFSDLRVQPIDVVLGWLEEQPRRGCCERGCRVDLVAYAGDDTIRFIFADDYFERLANYAHYGLVAVIGNDDPPQARGIIRGRSVYEVHTRPVSVGPFLLLGLEGAPRAGVADVDIGTVLLDEPVIWDHLMRCSRGWQGPIVVVSHAPPHGCLDEALRFSPTGEPRSIGSVSLRRFVESDPRVRLVICGHVHRMGGTDQVVGAATVVNVASHDNEPTREVRAAIVRIRAGADCEVRHVGIPVRYLTGRRARRLLAVWQLDEVYAGWLRRKGISTLEDLAYAQPHELARMMGWRETRKVSFWSAHARSLLEGHEVVLEEPNLPGPPRVYVDIETDTQGRYCWLVSAAGDEGPTVQMLSNSGPRGERKVLRDFLDWLGGLGNVPMLWYGSHEKWVLPDRLRAHGLPIPETLQNAADVFRECFARMKLALPLERFDLKGVAKWAGYRPRHPDLDGLLVASRYEKAVRLPRDNPRRGKQMRILMEYGEDDVLGLRRFVHWVDLLKRCP